MTKEVQELALARESYLKKTKTKPLPKRNDCYKRAKTQEPKAKSSKDQKYKNRCENPFRTGKIKAGIGFYFSGYEYGECYGN